MVDALKMGHAEPSVWTGAITIDALLIGQAITIIIDPVTGQILGGSRDTLAAIVRLTIEVKLTSRAWGEVTGPVDATWELGGASRRTRDATCATMRRIGHHVDTLIVADGLTGVTCGLAHAFDAGLQRAADLATYAAMGHIA